MITKNLRERCRRNGVVLFLEKEQRFFIKKYTGTNSKLFKNHKKIKKYLEYHSIKRLEDAKC
jgi:hypothetical protein